MARQTARLFEAHDNGHKSGAIDACENVDAFQFRFLDEDSVSLAAGAFVNALWAKDDIELQHMAGGELSTEGIEHADYSPVVRELRKRAAIIGADMAYAREKARAWRRHKAGGDYWSPYLRAQVHELRAALQDPDYPGKPKYGTSGPGPEPMRYVLASELHDMKTDTHVDQGIDVLVPYFERILDGDTDESGN